MHGTDQPQKHVDQVHPHGVLHPHNAGIAFGVFVDVHLAEYAKDCDPEDAKQRGELGFLRKEISGEVSQEDRVPGEGEVGFDKRNPVDQACHDGEAADDDGVKLERNVSNLSKNVSRRKWK
ncbi:hypothetical protein GP486_001466 [Trichoglossum hirsutum]|uniref:Uncharacterized protein n=1 Tax=Trichoglossum hirsutum TaxID=265104 RepID=A0A9P8LGZ4_9PEZI|nr:hypothetical protein GP486_001466 [Trichoglossum hirsutum]